MATYSCMSANIWQLSTIHIAQFPTTMRYFSVFYVMYYTLWNSAFYQQLFACLWNQSSTGLPEYRKSLQITTDHWRSGLTYHRSVHNDHRSLQISQKYCRSGFTNCQWRNNRACKACSACGPSAVGAKNLPDAVFLKVMLAKISVPVRKQNTFCLVKN